MLEYSLLKAEVIYNGIGTARANAAVAIQSSNRSDKSSNNLEDQIVAVDNFEVLRQNFPKAIIKDVGFAISPHPVNAHTHLDLSHMPLHKSSYTDFVCAVMEYDNLNKNKSLTVAKAGLKEISASGVNIIGDIVRSEEVMEWLLQKPNLQGVAYWEVIAPNPDDAEEVFQSTVARLRKFKALQHDNGIKVGLSPHSPHTVSEPLLVKLSAFAKQNKLPMQIHVAESAAEVELHQKGNGELMEFMRSFLKNWQPSGLSPVQYLKKLGVLKAQPTLVHGVEVDEEDVRAIQNAGCVVVHCPRSNLTLNCQRFPWELYMKHGVEVALGTDSRGSSPTLSITDEVAAAKLVHNTKLSPLTLIRAVVKGGYKALNMEVPRFTKGDYVNKIYIW